jgi:hypothetical protein
MKTKPRGIWATFRTECASCRGELTVTNSRPDPHECRDKPVTLADIRAALGRRT